jgi:hypothetical protein
MSSLLRPDPVPPAKEYQCHGLELSSKRQPPQTVEDGTSADQFPRTTVQSEHIVSKACSHLVSPSCQALLNGVFNEKGALKPWFSEPPNYKFGA